MCHHLGAIAPQFRAWDYSIYGFSIYPILYLPLAFPPLVSVIRIYVIHFDFDDTKWLNDKSAIYGSDF